MDKIRSLFNCALILTAHQASAAITDTGPWTGADWYDQEKKMGVDNGIPYSNDSALHRRIRSPLSVDGPLDNYKNFRNVQMVESVFPASEWSTAFPYANSFYTYDEFLKGVAKFPMFCNETALNWPLEKSCRKELANLFAHIGQETGKREGA